MVPALSYEIPRVSHYSGYTSSCSHFRIQDFHLLWSTFPGSSTSSFNDFIVFLTPVILLYLVWALPISLATTLRIVFTFFSYGYWDVSVPHVPFLYTTLLMYGYIVSFYYVSFLIRTSMALWIFAPPHSFSQLITSFFGSQCQGILLMLLFAWP